MFLSDVLEDSYDEAMKSYYASEERITLDSIASERFNHLVEVLPDSLKSELTDFRQSMVDLMASESCTAYVTGIRIGISGNLE